MIVDGRIIGVEKVNARGHENPLLGQGAVRQWETAAKAGTTASSV